MGLASPEEASQLECLLPFYPELQSALSDFGFQLELFAIQHEEPPPPGLFQKIQDRVRELPAVRDPEETNGSHAKQDGDSIRDQQTRSNKVQLSPESPANDK